MTDVLVRDVPDDVVAALDARAARLGLSRSEYLRRRLAQEAGPDAAPVTAEHLAAFAETFVDLTDPEVMNGAWGVTGWLVDTSALVRLGRSASAATWADRIDRGLVRISTVTRLEVGYSARSGPGLRAAAAGPPLASMPVEYQTPAIEDRAVQVQMALADLGRHRAPSIPDLLVSATAELAGLTVLHLDKDFDLIAEITGQPTERLDGD